VEESVVGPPGFEFPGFSLPGSRGGLGCASQATHWGAAPYPTRLDYGPNAIPAAVYKFLASPRHLHRGRAKKFKNVAV